MFHSLSLLTLSLAGLAAASPLSTQYDSVPRLRSGIHIAPLVAEYHPHGSVNNSYIVVFKDGFNDAHIRNHFSILDSAHAENPLDGDAAAGLQQVYDGHIKGYAGRFSEATVDAIRRMPEVDYVEKDQIVHHTVEEDDISTQRSAPWGLARISHRKRLTFGTFSRYEYIARGGEGVDVYVIDTGINIKHVEFEGRASWGKTMPQNDVDEDGNGHGSHCAGTIASRKYGVAKAAKVIAVKVLGSNGSGTMSDVVGGVVWAAQQAVAKAEAAKAEYAATGKTSHKGSVANMSLGGGKSQALDDAVNRAVRAGMHFAVAAGNDNKDACNYSPAAAELAVTVAASTLGDERAYFSNHGACVDVFAPGLNILSTWTGSSTAVNTISGTSMASPHAAGLLAYLLSIYPSVTFDPTLGSSSVADQFVAALSNDNPSPVFTTSLSSSYSAVHAVLPNWVSSLLPSPSLVQAADTEIAPIPVISPKDLKRALLALSTKGILAELPENTVNLLIFNNATSS